METLAALYRTNSAFNETLNSKKKVTERIN